MGILYTKFRQNRGFRPKCYPTFSENRKLNQKYFLSTKSRKNKFPRVPSFKNVFFIVNFWFGYIYFAWFNKACIMHAATGWTGFYTLPWCNYDVINQTDANKVTQKKIKMADTMFVYRSFWIKMDCAVGKILRSVKCSKLNWTVVRLVFRVGVFYWVWSVLNCLVPRTMIWQV